MPFFKQKPLTPEEQSDYRLLDKTIGRHCKQVSSAVQNGSEQIRKLQVPQFECSSRNCRPCKVFGQINEFSALVTTLLAKTRNLPQDQELENEIWKTWLLSETHAKEGQAAREETTVEQTHATVCMDIGAKLVEELNEKGAQLRAQFEKSRELFDKYGNNEITEEIWIAQRVEVQSHTVKVFDKYVEDGRKAYRAAANAIERYESIKAKKEAQRNEAGQRA